jgi:hypothetical protein
MRMEDLDTAAEDHIADETHYACLTRPLLPKPEQPTALTADQTWERDWGPRRRGGELEGDVTPH